MTRRTAPALAAALTAVLAGAPLVHAGGFARPNPISARSVGMGGAFAAVADDPTALHFNPAGMARLHKSHIMLGGEFVVAPRTYVNTSIPEQAGIEQSPTSPIRPLPSLGFATRFSDDGVPSRIAFGVGFWNTYGGQIDYPEILDANGNEIPGVVSSRNAVLEVVPGVAYEISDVLAIGFAARFGIGLFDVRTVSDPSNSEVSATGLGAGFSLGLMITPSETLSIGATYRSPMTIDASGTGSVNDNTGLNASVTQKWPQSAALGVAWRAARPLLLAAQVDWTGWSRWDELSVSVGSNRFPRRLDFDDNFALHLGTQYDIGPRAAARLGYTYDSPAVPDHTIQRTFLDSHKHVFGTGGSVLIVDSLRLDAAFEIVPGIGSPRVVEDNSADVPAWTGMTNVAPGEHSGKVYTLELALQYLY